MLTIWAWLGWDFVFNKDSIYFDKIVHAIFFGMSLSVISIFVFVSSYCCLSWILRFCLYHNFSVVLCSFCFISLHTFGWAATPVSFIRFKGLKVCYVFFSSFHSHAKMLFYQQQNEKKHQCLQLACAPKRVDVCLCMLDFVIFCC